MRRSIPVLFAVVLASACGGQVSTTAPSARDVPPAASASPATAMASAVSATGAPTTDTPSDNLNAIPLAACALDSYVEFVNAFAQFAHERPRFVTESGRAQLGDFDMALVDYRWQRQSDGAALEVEITRSESRLDVAATPVERDDDDAPVRTLGPTRRYVFEHRDGCWRYSGLR